MIRPDGRDVSLLISLKVRDVSFLICLKVRDVSLLFCLTSGRSAF